MASDEGPVLEVMGRTLGCPPDAEDLERLVGLARPAPCGRGEETLADPDVRDALQIDSREVRLDGPSWAALQGTMLEAVHADVGLADAQLKIEPLKLLVYRKGGHFSMHTDTEKTPGMVASLLFIVPGEYTGGALTIEHAAERLSFGAGGADRLRSSSACRRRVSGSRIGIWRVT